ncbi:hypothetical protein FisN_2Lh579 [Fistulifera solaris]|uniref:Uncharacterized protein n=1 Tax=Fistulifera solaris TaxID=1519565 RepID=A0A1Z5K921_FISSO|nr:hypothetical protein FisN_2Lh579 [Fistulifera solaris]|eukprot:GAX22744.1 hypothetical protein FisN_2Lh579 [Fistulifera solaris]
MTSTSNEPSNMDKMKVSMNNCWASTLACGKNTKEKALIQKLKFDLESRKKAFGVDYLTKLKQGANEQDLKLVLETAQKDIADLEHQIKEKEDIIEGNTVEAKKKIETNKSTVKPATPTAAPPAAQSAPVVEPSPVAPAPVVEPSMTPLKTVPSDEHGSVSNPAVTVEQ